MADTTIGPSRLSRSTVGGSPFPPIADYGFISDCEVCALIRVDERLTAEPGRTPEGVETVTGP